MTKEDLIKERNEIAKQLFWRDQQMSCKDAVKNANALMREMYGEDWDKQANDPKTGEQTGQPTATTDSTFGYAITIVDHNNEKWVRVQAMGEDFIIAPHDLDGGKDDFDYDTAIARLKELGLDTFNRMQGFIIATLIEEINAKLVEAGGDKFAEDIYVSSELWRPVGSSADCDGYNAWYFPGTYGCFYSSSRYYSYFRSRPVLAYSTSKR